MIVTERQPINNNTSVTNTNSLAVNSPYMFIITKHM